MKKLFSLLSLLLFTPAVFANSSDLLHPKAISHFTDLSVNYLSQIFGTVGNVLSGNGSQMMGKLFYVLNNGILLAAVLVISYAVLISTVRMASEGVSVAQGKSTLFSLLKLAVGVVLVVPSATTGYSLLQTMVMKVVVEGVSLADSIWDHGLDYLAKGGMVWSDPAGGQANSQVNLMSAANIKAMFGKDSKFARQVFADEVCMYRSRDPLISNNVNEPENAVSADVQMRPMYSVWADNTNHTFNFPGLDDTNATSGSSCGSVSWDVLSSCDQRDRSNCATTRQAVSSLVFGMLPLAQKYYCSQASGSSTTCADVSVASNHYAYSALFRSMLNYYSAMNMYAEIRGKKADTTKAAFIKGAKSEGWLNAGRYYWDLMQFTGQTEASSQLSSYVVAATMPDSKLVSQHSLTNLLADAAGQISGSDDSYVLDGNNNVTSGFQNHVNEVYGQAQEVAQDSDSDTPPLLSGAAAAIIAPTYINPGVGATLTTAAIGLDVIGGMFDNPENNPIQFLYDIGQACLKLTLSIWIIGGVLIGATMFAFGICQASSPLAVVGQTVASWFTPFITMIAMMLWISGFFLSYYVPLYPYMIFLFASMGWFISVIEAMVAAPLVAVGLAHPENHDFLGKAEQAVMLLLGVFIQPALLVIGLIAGIIFSFVSFKLLIYSYSGFVTDIMGSTPSNTHDLNIIASAVSSPLYDASILLTQPLLLVVFCTLTYTLLTQSFSLVFVLRDNVMRWIGAPGSGLASPEQLVGETKGAITGMGKASGEAGGQAMNGGIKTADEGGKKAGEQMKSAATGSAESG